MTEISHEIRTLNGLIADTFDSIEGFTVAAGDAKDQRLGEMFHAHALERGIVVRSLQAEVLRVGGDPEEGGTLLAGLHRNFLRLKAAIARNDLRAILDEVERGEDHLKARFEKALADNALSLESKAAIRKGFASVRKGNDQMRDFEQSLAIAA